MNQTLSQKNRCEDIIYQFLPEQWQYLKSVLPINVYFPENKEIITQWLQDKQFQIIQTIQDLSSSSEQQEEITEFMLNCCQTIYEQSPVSCYSAFSNELIQKLNQFSSQSHFKKEIRVSKFFCNEDLPSLLVLHELLENPQYASFQDTSCSSPQEDKQNLKESLLNKNSGELFIDLSSSKEKNDISPATKNLFSRYKIVTVNNSKHTIKQLRESLIQIYNFFGWKVPNLYRPLIFYPDYLNNITSLLRELLDKPGPLHRDFVYNIALMTAASQKSLYIFNLFADKTVAFLGNTDYLKHGFQSLPKKLNKFWELIQAANQHPRVFLQHYKELFSFLMSANESGEPWSYNELIFGFLIVILIQYHCTLAHSLALLHEQDCTNWNFQQSIQSPYKKKASSTQNKFQKSQEHLFEFIVQATKIWEEQPHSSSNKDKQDSDSCSDDYIEEQISQSQISGNVSKFQLYTRKSFLLQQQQQQQQQQQLQLQINDGESSSPGANNYSLISNSPIEIKSKGYSSKNSIHLPSSESISTNVSSNCTLKDKKKKKKHNYLNHSDFNWNQNSYTMLNEQFPDLTEIIHNKREQVHSMNANKIGVYKDIEFKFFQVAIWRYVEIILGYYREDYNDKKMNQIFQPPFKDFIKKVVFNPSSITQRDWDNIPYLFEVHELIHILIIIAEAKFYTQLIIFQYSLENAMKSLI